MDCSAPSLHQPANEDACIPDPSPLNRIFEFNIYLPRDPRSIYQAAGKVVPPVPLYFQALPGAGPNPSIRVVREGDVSYLHVAIDMNGFSGQIYSRRIVAAWAYPSPDNWGLRSWRVRLNSIDVHDRRSGDWRMWLTTPNTDREWTRIIECDNCITEGTLTSLHVSGGSLPLPIETGGLLGPDLLLFRGQNVIVQASGYAAGFEGLGDDLGVINDSWPQQSADYSRLSDAGKYTLNYSVFPGPAPRRPSLSTSASDLYSAYRLTPGNIPPFPPPVASPVITSLRERVLAPSAQSTPADALQFRKREEGPGKTLDSITVADFRQSLTRAVSRGRATKVERTLLKLQQYFEEGLRSGLRAHFLAGLPNRLRWLKQSLPRDWYDKYFVAIGGEINVIGDVNGDGVIDAEDLQILDSAIQGNRTLTTDEFLRADVAAPCGDRTPAALQSDRQMISAYIAASSRDANVPGAARPAEMKSACRPGAVIGSALIR